MKTWELEPATCTCTRMVVETLDETMGCPMGWRWEPLIERWVHE